jgi:hypothetical protein
VEQLSVLILTIPGNVVHHFKVKKFLWMVYHDTIQCGVQLKKKWYGSVIVNRPLAIFY